MYTFIIQKQGVTISKGEMTSPSGFMQSGEQADSITRIITRDLVVSLLTGDKTDYSLIIQPMTERDTQ